MVDVVDVVPLRVLVMCDLAGPDPLGDRLKKCSSCGSILIYCRWIWRRVAFRTPIRHIPTLLWTRFHPRSALKYVHTPALIQVALVVPYHLYRNSSMRHHGQSNCKVLLYMGIIK
jgi:hypothetical protein